MKIQVISEFYDKFHTSILYKVGAVLDFDDERASDIIAKKLAVPYKPAEQPAPAPAPAPEPTPEPTPEPEPAPENTQEPAPEPEKKEEEVVQHAEQPDGNPDDKGGEVKAGKADKKAYKKAEK